MRGSKGKDVQAFQNDQKVSYTMPQKVSANGGLS
jgi:hypothetical protein